MANFSRARLLFRNLRYFRAANLAVVAGMAVATAVLTGALMVGDSVRGSLRDLTERGSGSSITSWRRRGSSSSRWRSGWRMRRRSRSGSSRSRRASRSAAARPRGRQGQGRGRADHRAGGAPSRRGGRGGDQHRAGSRVGRRCWRGPAVFIAGAGPSAERVGLARRGRNETILTVSVDRSRVVEPGAFQDLFNLSGGQCRTQRVGES